MLRHGFLPSVLLFVTFLTTGPRAEIPGLTWEDPEVVDTGVVEVSSPAGVSVLRADSLWHVVYEKAGDIYRRARSSEGWLSVERLTDDPAISRNPHVATHTYDPELPHHIYVVWEDDRTGHFEVWTRSWNGSLWSAEECLTCDSTVSRSPVVVGLGEFTMFAWEEVANGTSKIQGRLLEYGVWGAVEDISQSPADATEPTIGTSGPFFIASFTVAWTDSRHGESEIYSRSLDPSWGEWWDEERLTDLPGSCRRPSIHVELCCGDVIEPLAVVVFESDASGTPEIYSACRLEGPDEPAWVEIITPDDGVPSGAPSVGGFAFLFDECDFGGPGPRHFMTWTDGDSADAASHPIQYGSYCSGDGTDLLSDEGTSVSTVGVIEGSPEAELMALWVEETVTGRELLSRRGRILGCSEFGLAEEPPPSLLLAPEGIPSNTVRFMDLCSGGPEQGFEIFLEFEDELDADLTWDPLQEHPEFSETTDSEGEVVFSIRGGGCSQAGRVFLRCWFSQYYHVWGGAKSPDVDGNCIVTGTDLSYVQSMMGTDDYCADLDGSGVVDEDDVAIVVSTLGDHCSHITATPQPGGGVPLGVWIEPNPFRHSARIRLSLPAETARARILDPSGRLVRDFGEIEGIGEILWDGRDGRSRPVAGGVYFLSLEVGGLVMNRQLVLLR
jgi:hypothetical protein